MPNIDALKGVLEHSATEQIPIPEVTAGRLVLRQAPAEREAAAERVLGVVHEYQGVAIRSDHDNGDVEILVQLPGAQAAAFREKLAGAAGKVDIAGVEGNVFIEVILTGSERP